MAYQHTSRLSHILPALLVNCHFENVYACIQDQHDLVVLAQVPNKQKQNMNIDPKDRLISIT